MAVENREKMEETGCEIICGAPTTIAVKGQMIIIMMMMMMIPMNSNSAPKQPFAHPSSFDFAHLTSI